ncbi:MAG: DNA polymerase III subunit gamma/tau, partial [Gammaproteobacteria bacterium HGW-Gammaproteobacteria-7]
DNAQYMPARGRTKVYLIDEVHMLSKPAFNALLKTLEEPPEHVKFLLATTDPDKLPVTVLSRCLQFNLKRLDVEQIEGQIARILDAEEIASDPASRRLLAKAADGSLRDGLSLLDQAIAYGGGALDETAVREMLGSVDRHRIDVLLTALAQASGEALMNEVSALSELSPDFPAVLDELAATLHQIQLRQLVPGLNDAEVDSAVSALADALEPELVQLWYRMALDGRVEIPLAPSARTGFEMVLLRMLAFRPVGAPGVGAQAPSADRDRQPSPPRPSASAAPDSARPASRIPDSAGAVGSARAAGRREDAPAPTPSRPDADQPVARSVAEPAAPSSIAESAGPPVASAGAGRLIDNESWLALLAKLELRGPARELAAHSAFEGYQDGNLSLTLGPGLT